MYTRSQKRMSLIKLESKVKTIENEIFKRIEFHLDSPLLLNNSMIFFYHDHTGIQIFDSSYIEFLLHASCHFYRNHDIFYRNHYSKMLYRFCCTPTPWIVTWQSNLQRYSDSGRDAYLVNLLVLISIN